MNPKKKGKRLTNAEKQRLYRERRRLMHSEKEEENKIKDRERYHSKKKLINDLSEREKEIRRGKGKRITNAEKQRLYRERRRLMHLEKEEDNKIKDRERYHSKKKLISDLSEREKEIRRENTRARVRYYREKQKKISHRREKRPEISESESSSLTTGMPSRMVIALDLATLKTSAPGTSVKMDPDSSLTDQDLHLALTCEVFPTDEPESLFKIKEEPIDPDTCKQDILSDSVMQELRHFSKKPSSACNHGGSLFQTPVFIKEEPISSEDEM